jgi:26S proteasome regulatory subunit N4
MGFIIPESTTPAEAARSLMTRKDGIEAEIQAQMSILATNGNSTMTTPLVDREGFPRADIDVWAVRHARVRIIELRNDLRDVTDQIANALAVVYANSSSVPEVAASDDVPTQASVAVEDDLQPFARVDGVAPGSPAAVAVRLVIPACSMPVTSTTLGPSTRRSRAEIWNTHEGLLHWCILTTAG